MYIAAKKVSSISIFSLEFGLSAWFLIILIEAVMNNFSLFLKLLSDLFSSFEVDFAYVSEQIFVLFDKWSFRLNLGLTSLLTYGWIKSFGLLNWTLNIWLNILFDLAGFAILRWLFRTALFLSSLGLTSRAFIVVFTFVIFTLSVSYICLVIIENFLRLSELALAFFEICVFVDQLASLLIVSHKFV